MKLLVPDALHDTVAPLFPPAPDDVLISYLWPRRVPAEELAGYRVAVNFHPAPLPEYRGFAPYTWGILNRAPVWGVTLHRMVAEIDAGDILISTRWTIDHAEETAESLREASHYYMLKMLHDHGASIPRMDEWRGSPQGAGRYYSKLDFENARRSAALDPAVARRAFHCPPWPGWEPVRDLEPPA